MITDPNPPTDNLLGDDTLFQPYKKSNVPSSQPQPQPVFIPPAPTQPVQPAQPSYSQPLYPDPQVPQPAMPTGGFGIPKANGAFPGGADETPITETVPTIPQETLKPVAPERPIDTERLRVPEVAPQPNLREELKVRTETPTAIPQPIISETTKPKDGKPEHHKVHPVGPHADKLTSIADKDEEDFIEEVINIHEHK